MAKFNGEHDNINAMVVALSMFAPAMMLSLNANVDINFEDFDDIKNHPMAGPAMMSFSELFEGMLGMNVDEVKATRLNVPEGGSEGEKVKFFLELQNAF